MHHLFWKEHLFWIISSLCSTGLFIKRYAIFQSHT